MPNNKPALYVENVKKYYVSRKKHVLSDGSVVRKAFIKSVDDVAFSLKAGEVLGVIGESGCGKSTLGRLIVRLEPTTDGHVFYDGEDAEALLKKDKLAFRKMTQMVFQNPFETFDPRHTIEKALLRTLTLHHIGKSKTERREMILARFTDAGLVPAERMLERFPHELSGGQLQRISVIRSVMLSPKVIVADEPVSMLDVSVRADIVNMLHSAAKNYNLGLIFISHDISLTRYISDSIIVMYLGNIMEYGSASDVIDRPLHPYTKVLLSNSPNVDPREKRAPIRLKGEPPTPVDVPDGCAFSRRCPEAKEDCMTVSQQLRDISGRLVSCMHIDL
ncbi:MAG: ATP-binding cassette domain-containing protein [Clostridiales Family XIII bacterium]|nr:ATP-binding cassette domain-containing protein [Clostridiales Family XIII bacterium]